MRRTPQILMALMLSAAASSAKVTFDFDSQADFSEYRGFAWVRLHDKSRPIHGLSPPHLNHQIMNERIQNAIERELLARGYELGRAREAHFLVAFRTGVQRRWRSGGTAFYYGGPRRWRWGYWAGHVHSYPYVKDLLVVDLIDGRTHRMVWRGWIEVSLENPKRAEKRIGKAVKKLLDRFPP